jgi:hypothetical protein
MVKEKYREKDRKGKRNKGERDKEVSKFLCVRERGIRKREEE